MPQLPHEAIVARQAEKIRELEERVRRAETGMDNVWEAMWELDREFPGLDDAPMDYLEMSEMMIKYLKAHVVAKPT